VQNLGQEIMDQLGPLQTQQATQFTAPQNQQFRPDLQNQMFGQIGGYLETLGMTPEQLGASQLDLARQIAAPGEQEARVANQQNLFSSGRMGTTGGAGQTQALAKAQAMADLQRQQMAFNQGQTIQQQAGANLTNVMGQGLGLARHELGLNQQNFMQGLEGARMNELLREGLYGRDYRTGGFNADRMMDRWGIGQNLFSMGQQARMEPWQQIGFGTQNLGQIQQLQMNPFKLAQAGRTAQSNAGTGAASVMQQSAASTPSPFADMIAGGMSMFNPIDLPFSDERLKDDIEFVGEDGKGHRWYTWSWNAQAKLLGIKQATFGVIAQEVRKYNPAAVVKGPQGFLTVNYGAL
jgi:hypothetical protein